MPKCTVAIPIYNRKEMIDDTLQSVLDTDCHDVEILLVDDCSDDGVWEHIQNYHDLRLRLVRNERNIGLFANFNRCLTLARGEYIRILCNDDRLCSDSLSSECEFLDAHPEIVLLNTTARIVGCADELLGYTGQCLAEGIYEGRNAIRAALKCLTLYVNPFSCPSGVMLRGKIVKEHHLKFDEEMQMAGDYAFYLNMLEYGDLAVFHTEGAIVRAHPGSAGFKQKLSSIPLKEMVEITAHYMQDFFDTSERQSLVENIAGRVCGYASIWYLRGYRSEARAMFHVIDELCVARSVRIRKAIRYLILEFFSRLDKNNKGSQVVELGSRYRPLQ
jgi:glycosyltransferase involved in cell wall biosynthesis